MDESYESLCVQLEKLRFENADLRMMLDIVRENYDLQSKLISTQRTNNETGSKVPTDSKKLERLVGEIAFQLERRILFHVFPRQTRLYGFTVLNIPEKILQVSKHPLTGRMDEDFRYDLSQRHLELMERLRMLGYSAAIHAPFAEYIVNTYGILKQRPDTYIAEEMGYNSPEFLRNIVIKTASSKLLKDLLCLLSCLCFMARQDRKPLFLW
ncbi:hypothetical protein AAFF_G00403980 [Aldrovandia affinis]|uniref:Speriolin C-terminal domain-containing protein n=1 Tax=Aldrovandia affinis TaxID=143900 RepID=A0AAD7WZU6_9TELE|nr:hypothetical protein AAFF_G00403980 [Aldrovandia affinis]